VQLLVKQTTAVRLESSIPRRNSYRFFDKVPYEEYISPLCQGSVVNFGSLYAAVRVQIGLWSLR
jgi:hypothetical protein